MRMSKCSSHREIHKNRDVTKKHKEKSFVIEPVPPVVALILRSFGCDDIGMPFDFLTLMTELTEVSCHANVEVLEPS